MLTLSSALDNARRIHGDRPAIVDPEIRLTWSEFIDRAARAAGFLAERGVGPDARFGVLSRNTFRHHELLHAGYWGGATPVPVNIRLAAPEIRYILEDAAIDVVAIEDPFLPLLDTEALAPWREKAIRLPAPDNPANDDKGLPLYDDLLGAAEPAPLHDAGLDEDAILLYTGGTTGRSKGVRLSHLNVISDGLMLGYTCGFKPSDIYIHIAPMFHSADLIGTGYTLLGAAHAFLPQFTGDRFLEAVQSLGVTSTMMAPTMIIVMLSECDLSKYDLSSLRYLMYGSSPMAAEWIRRTLDAFDGVDVVQGYGLTETSPILTISPHAAHVEALATGNHERLRSVGRPMPGVDMRILDGEGNELPLGEPGEVVVRAPNASTRGYLNLPEATAQAFRNGWFHTGDVGHMDEEGYLYLLDRKKDMIITGGENVYSSEVEAAIYQHPKVHECAVFGVPDEKYGEAVFAAIVPAPGEAITDEEMIAHCRGKIGGYKIPRRMVFLEALPKSAMGKILKTELRKTYSGSERVKVS